MNCGNDGIDETADKQGWNTETVLGLVIEFLGTKKHASVLEELEEHLRHVAEEESEECSDDEQDVEAEKCHVCREPFDERRRCACEVEDRS